MSFPLVLLGDSAHTADFSIGSGTKLAMEDAIALVNAFEERDAANGNPAALSSALADYQMERKPIVERFQEAARQSQSYFESTTRYQNLEPEQFVFHLLVAQWAHGLREPETARPATHRARRSQLLDALWW